MNLEDADMFKRILGITAIGWLALGVTACSEYRDDLGDVAPREACAGCHGVEAPWAPAPDSRGNYDPIFRGVGAHQAHVLGGELGAKVPCATCHLVPDRVNSKGHIDSELPAEVRFANTAVAKGDKPELVVDGTGELAKVTCRNVACHGAGMDGGSNVEPQWNSDNPKAQVTCGSCHGIGPALTRTGAVHPAGKDCFTCHETVAEDGTIANWELHIDGKVQIRGIAGCNSCHGNDDNPAPPTDLNGESDTSIKTVGAHQAHLQDMALATALTCTDCHPAVTTVDSPGHMDGTTQISFGSRARRGDASPQWDVDTEKCSNSYCHGATLEGGKNTEPKWTLVDGSQIRCDSCHGMAPKTIRSGDKHPIGSDCFACHDTVDDTMRIVKPEQHIDGMVQFTPVGGCKSCHGSADNPAPPQDLAGNTATTFKTVGAHQAHIKDTVLSTALTCTDCHPVVGSVDAPGHIDGTTQIKFGARAKLDNAQPAWNDGDASCSNSYCHGATLEGGKATAPKWTLVDKSQVTCDSCHGMGPKTLRSGAKHPAGSDCLVCHDTVDVDNRIVKLEQHIDGKVQFTPAGGCKSCHGSADNPAPPKDLAGNTETTVRTVGAHQTHLKDIQLSTRLSCSDCHPAVTSVDAPGHLDGTTQIQFGDRAKLGGAQPMWNIGNATCTSTYCHGATLDGGKATAPKWTRVDGSQNTCDSCHGMGPAKLRSGADHPSSQACWACHDTVNAAGVIVKPGQHVDGIVQVSSDGSCNSCHGNQLNNAPPKDLAGNSDTSLRSVGAHQAHLTTPSQIGKAVDCSACHVVPAEVSDSGHLDNEVQLVFSGIANAGGAAPQWSRETTTCTNSYCHGATLEGGNNTNPNWTVVDGSQIACGSCHGLAPKTGKHPSNFADHDYIDDCSECHQGIVKDNGLAILDADRHIDGKVDVVLKGNGTWDSNTKTCAPWCHGAKVW